MVKSNRANAYAFFMRYPMITPSKPINMTMINDTPPRFLLPSRFSSSYK